MRRATAAEPTGHLGSGRRRWLRRLLIWVPVSLGVLFFALLLAAQAADDRAGCGSVDPTDPGNYSEISILNDVPMTVRVDDCVGGYCQVDESARLAPGQRFEDHAACAASGADMTSWRISTENGRVLGYIAVNTPRKHDGLVFPVSHASTDRKTPTRPA